MKDLGLNDNEFVIMQKECMNDGKYSGELYITNENIIFSYKEGIFNKKECYYKIALQSIKKSDDEYLISYDKTESEIIIYHVNGISKFYSEVNENESEIVYDSLVKIINQYIENNNHNCLEISKNYDNLTKDNIEEIKCLNCGTKNQKNANFCNNCGMKLSKEINNENKNIGDNKFNEIFKCKGCGAILKGIIGSRVKCEYCDLIQNLS